MSKPAPSWEEIVSWVTIASNYAMVAEAEQRWTAAFTQIDTLRDRLADLSAKTTDWKGGGADAFRAHLGALIRALAVTSERHRTIVHGLNETAAYLRQAVRTIPIPSWMYETVQAERQSFDQGGVFVEVAPGSFWQGLERWVSGGYPIANELRKDVEEFIRNHEEQAQQAYRVLRQGYGSAMTHFPESGTRAAVPGADSAQSAARNGSGRGAGADKATGKQPGTAQQTAQNSQAQQQAATAATTTPTTTTPTTTPETPPVATPGVTDPSTDPGYSPDPLPDIDPDSGFDPDDSKFGLAGVGSDLGSGGGIGGPGLGGGLGGGIGGGAAGLGGLGGGKLPPIGPAVTLPEGVMAAAAAARDRRLATPAVGGGAAGMGAMQGMMPMMGAPGLGPQGDQQTANNEWLTNEPAETFGPDRSTPPGVIA
ncbi:hypothetical protein GCM10022225_16010 [Plantactinospora mayteni]|uniref:PPE family domain-containing protein n=1 Tax=Plantactinospora mayteni TaxID=566021 RepID=A0ABQ4EG20_9ACTN|nr:hypothetical protein [Plantactinospora mayteni]GIG93675.1 hypothetical protein Pma05_02480 [Plantactinospora mayteni]